MEVNRIERIKDRLNQCYQNRDPRYEQSRAWYKDDVQYLLAAIEERDKNQHHENCDTRDPVIGGKPCNCYMLYKATLEDRNKELTAATRIVENQEAQIIRLAKEKEQAEARIKELKEINDGLVVLIKELNTRLAESRARVRELEALHDLYVSETAKQINELKLYKQATQNSESEREHLIKELNVMLKAEQERATYNYEKFRSSESYVKHLQSRLAIAREGMGEIKAVATLDAICEATNMKIIRMAEQALERMGE